MQHRVARVLGPTAAYVVLVSVVVIVLGACGVTGSVLEYAGWAVAMHLWFLAVYVVVVALNYFAFILGVSSVLTALGVDFRIARVLGGCCEAVYMYCALRWVVFRR